MVVVLWELASGQLVDLIIARLLAAAQHVQMTVVMTLRWIRHLMNVGEMAAADVIH
ncbi:hypothetical protein BH20ACI1_BH20ACI1_16470 [soil metagenome]